MEGRLSTACGFILILGAIGCSLALPRVKPGVCPRFALSSLSECVSNVRTVCKNDYDCKGKKKCCINRCGPVCADPLPNHSDVKPGLCPLLSIYGHSDCVPSLRPTCKKDIDCPEDDKCCRSRCGNLCLPPLLRDSSAKPGTCPRFPTLHRPVCALDALPECTNDNDCKGKQKCCRNLCGTVCADPLPVKDKVKPGVCPHFPISSLTECVVHVRPECTKDNDCKGKQKCCRNLCGPVCADPSSMKRGNCPPIHWLPGFWCRPGAQHECTDDSDCLHNFKCCTQQCGRVCSPPYPDIFPLE